MGAASRWWFHHSVQSLANSYAQRHIQLTLKQTDNAAETLLQLAKETGSIKLIYDICHEPEALSQASDVEKTLTNAGIEVEGIHTQTLYHPDDWANKEGKPYQVYTPFWKHTSGNRQVVHPPDSTQPTYHTLDNYPSSDALEDWQLLPTLDWDKGFYKHWQPGEDGAWKQFNHFLNTGIATYNDDRNKPAVAGVSKISPHLHFGDISVQALWHAVYSNAKKQRGQNARLTDDETTYLKEITWREFAAQLLRAFPNTPTENLKPAFNAYPWADDDESNERLKRWQQGQTGIPIVDAGMRELWHTGWMHNRVRMIVGSLLIKNCRIHWQHGAEWFWDTLVDADLASNTMGWQWVAGSGADASPYFRIFNPVTQGKRFDPDGEYVRHWVPELANVPSKFIHNPWEAPPLVLLDAGVTLGDTYPHPMVDLAESRHTALAGYDAVKATKASV